MELKEEKELMDIIDGNPALDVAIKLRSDKLTPRQVSFVLAYAGDPAKAAIKAGYKFESTGSLLLKRSDILNAIIDRDAALDKLPKSTDPLMDLHQLRQFWTGVISDDTVPMGHRIRTSELLAKSYGGFVEKLIVKSHEIKEQKTEISFAMPANPYIKHIRSKLKSSEDMKLIADTGTRNAQKATS